ncbi:hypothetical protein BDQ17DRAFT_1327170 [Cyathus striatus]|nr:hypothetical protein BDQ17DRAFT_1327170 [Cyathus striatus]
MYEACHYCFHEKKVPLEFHNIDLQKREHKSPEYLKYQPFGQDDEGFIFNESRAIAHYIAVKYASQGTLGLIPIGDAASAEMGNFDPHAGKAVRENLFKKLFGLTPDPEQFKVSIHTLSAKLDVYEKILSKQKYMANDKPNATRKLFCIIYEVDGKPTIFFRWFNEVRSRHSWKAVDNGVESVTSYDY